MPAVNLPEAFIFEIRVLIFISFEILTVNEPPVFPVMVNVFPPANLSGMTTLPAEEEVPKSTEPVIFI